jgi:hypothetical protein
MDNLDSSLIRILGIGVVIIFLASYAGEMAHGQVIQTESITESTITTNGKTETTLKSPPPSAISPTINTSNSDLCTFGVAGAIQTQILGISTGTQFTDENCERLKNSKTLYDMGMKVAAVSLMCQDQRVFDAMMHAGTPCPYNGMIGDAAKAGWASDSGEEPSSIEEDESILNDKDVQTGAATGGIGALLALLLLL